LPPTLAASAAIVFLALAAGAAPAADPNRLARDVVPTFEAIHLDLDGAKQIYTGSVTIELQVHAAVDSFRLHARGMTLTRVMLRRGKAAIPVTTHPGAIGLLTVVPATTLRPGVATLLVDFTKEFSTRANSLYRVATGGGWYAFTDFEPDDARGAWPCWDEPSFKIPWQVTVRIPKEHRAFSNTLPARETVAGEKRRVVFRRTPPLSSYLVAVVTGPFETVPIPELSVPGRVVAVRGNGRLAGQVVKETPPIVAALERYFGARYPYEKLDLIAVPEFSSGAMENAAAITFRENRLLLDPRTMSPSQRKGLISTTAHELAHMWFGDLVTLAWWDDLWLNESFASWLGDKVSAEVAPEFHFEIDEVSGTLRAMATDSRLTTRAIRARLLATDNLGGLFDELSYDKGQAVLNMLERGLTPEKFRAGVRTYLAAHAGGNATAADLWAALSAAASRDVASVAASFLDQPGVPLVTLEPLGGGRVRLSQRRFLNSGLAEPGRALWKIPVTLRYAAGGREVTQHVLLADSTQTVRLETDSTPAWSHPNADERGYYRWSAPASMLSALATEAPRALSPRERVGFLGNLRALLDAGQVHGDQYLAMLASFANDPDPQVVATVVAAMGTLQSPFVTPETRSGFAAYVRRSLEPALERVGWTPAAGEPQTVTLLRPQLLLRLGDDGRDPRALEWGRKAAAASLKDSRAVDPSLQDAALSLGAIQGDAALFDAYRARFERATVPTERSRYLSGLASFADTALAERALRYAAEGPLRPQEIMTIPNGLAAHSELRDRVFEWTMKHYDYIASRIPPWHVPDLPQQAAGCSLERAAKARAFFSTPAHAPVGTAAELEKMEAAVRDCAGLHDRESATVARYLAQLRP
jgi:alanyl aminopeptidase